MAKRRRSGGNRYGRLLSGAVGVAQSYARKRARTLTQTKTKSSGDNGGVTNQYDTKVMYRRRRVSRRKIRYAVKRKRAFTRNVMNYQGCQQFIFTTQTEPISTVNQQTHSSFMFCSSSGVAPNDDLTLITNNIQTSGVAANYRKNQMVFVQMACVDITMYNITATTADVDVYFIHCKDDNIAGTSIQGAWNTMITGEQKPDGSAITNVANTTLGCTPWQSPQWCRSFTIDRKRKYLLTQGQTAHFQVKQGRRIINLEKRTEYNFLRGMTGVLIVWNGVNPLAITGYPATQLSITYMRTYNVKYQLEGDDRLVNI